MPTDNVTTGKQDKEALQPHYVVDSYDTHFSFADENTQDDDYDFRVEFPENKDHNEQYNFCLKIRDGLNNYQKLLDSNRELQRLSQKLIDVATKETSNLVAWDGAEPLDRAIDNLQTAINNATKLH